MHYFQMQQVKCQDMNINMGAQSYDTYMIIHKRKERIDYETNWNQPKLKYTKVTRKKTNHQLYYVAIQ